jgi:transcriptional regulator with XRE-family HTH domain
MEAREMVADLVAHGLRQTEIAERTGLRQGAISKVLTGTVEDVMSRTYRKLQALHDEVCGRNKTEGAH